MHFKSVLHTPWAFEWWY